MELLSPDLGLIFWSLLSITNLILCIIAIIKIANDNSIEPGKKLVWLLAIIFFPLIGALTLTAYYKKTRHQKA